MAARIRPRAWVLVSAAWIIPAVLAIRAFEAQALDYLVKPVFAARFAATIHRLRRQLRRAAPASSDPSIIVPTTRGAIVIGSSEIDWIEATPQSNAGATTGV